MGHYIACGCSISGRPNVFVPLLGRSNGPALQRERLQKALCHWRPGSGLWPAWLWLARVVTQNPMIEKAALITLLLNA